MQVAVIPDRVIFLSRL